MLWYYGTPPDKKKKNLGDLLQARNYMTHLGSINDLRNNMVHFDLFYFYIFTPPSKFAMTSFTVHNC